MRKYFLLGFILIAIGLCWVIYKEITYTKIYVKFADLRPFNNRIPVYYKGIVIGEARGKKHSDDYKYTIVKLVLYPKNLMLPSNTEVLLKKKIQGVKISDFIELVYPKNPTNKMICNGCIINGSTTVDIDEFMKNNKLTELEEIKENLLATTQNLNQATKNVNTLLVNVNAMLKQNQTNIENTTSNISNLTTKINDSLNQTNLDSTVSNIEKITDNLNKTTENINTIIPEVSSTIENTQDITANVSAITCGVRQTLRKPFGGMRVLFGKSINEPRCKACGQS